MIEHTVTLPSDARILIAKPRAGIGDFILLMPALRALRRQYPQARIDLLVAADLKPLINRKSMWELSLFDSIIVSPKKIPPGNLPGAAGVSSEYTNFIKLLRTLHTSHYDAALLFQHLESHIALMRLLMLATGARWRVGFDNDQAAFLNVKVAHEGFGVRHQAEYAMCLVEAVGAMPHDRDLFFPLNDEERLQARSFFNHSQQSRHTRPFIAMHPGCASYMKARRWSPTRFARVADEIYAEFGGELILLGGPEELPLREQVVASMQSNMPVYTLSGHEGIDMVAAIIQQCDLFIGNDSGLMHLSVAVSTPTLGVFGLTNHRAWGPYTPGNPDRSIAVHLDLACMPCAYSGHTAGSLEGCPTRDCLNRLQVHTVVAAARQLLQQAKDLSLC